MTRKPRDLLQPVDAEALRLARTLLRNARHGALAFLDAETGGPGASRVAVATDLDGTPIILVSALSAHTPAIRKDARCSLLLGEPGKGDPLAHSRMTLAARAMESQAGSVEHGRLRRRFLNRHPKSALYADFADFAFFRLIPESASLNGGFARAYRLSATELLLEHARALGFETAEQPAIEHMNSDHGDAIDLYARHFAGASGTGWKIVGIDPEGLDLMRRDDSVRIFFPTPPRAPEELRATLVSMAADARGAG